MGTSLLDVTTKEINATYIILYTHLVEGGYSLISTYRIVWYNILRINASEF